MWCPMIYRDIYHKPCGRSPTAWRYVSEGATRNGAHVLKGFMMVHDAMIAMRTRFSTHVCPVVSRSCAKNTPQSLRDSASAAWRYPYMQWTMESTGQYVDIKRKKNMMIHFCKGTQILHGAGIFTYKTGLFLGFPCRCAYSSTMEYLAMISHLSGAVFMSPPLTLCPRRRRLAEGSSARCGSRRIASPSSDFAKSSVRLFIGLS
jgi:hypothetical protein